MCSFLEGAPDSGDTVNILHHALGVVKAEVGIVAVAGRGRLSPGKGLNPKVATMGYADTSVGGYRSWAPLGIGC